MWNGDSSRCMHGYASFHMIENIPSGLQGVWFECDLGMRLVIGRGKYILTAVVDERIFDR